MGFIRRLASNKYFLIMTVIFLVAIIVRACFFVGFGRGDDSIYIGVARNIINVGMKQALDLQYGANYRVGLYFPIALFISLFGINDFSFVLYPLLTSLGSIIVIYFIGKELFGKETGIIAAVLMTFCPFDAVFSSTMAIDIMNSFFTALGFLFFIKGYKGKGWLFILYFVIASLATFFNFLIKIPSILIIPCFVCISLINFRAYKRHLVFYGSFTILFAMSFVVDYFLTGSLFNRWHTQMSQSGGVMGPYWNVFLDYLKWMFCRMPDGGLLFGYLFHALLPALLYVGIRRLKPSYSVIIWVLSMFILLEFLPKHFHLPYVPGPRWPRYTHAFLIPSALIIAAALYSLLKWKKSVFAIIFAGIIISSVIESRILYKVWADPFSDANEASKFMATLDPNKRIIADGWFYIRFDFDSKYKRGNLMVWTINGKNLQMDILQKKDFAVLEKVRDVYVVVGGSRAVFAGMFSVFNFGDFKPPDHWKLIKEIPKELAHYRLETLKIYEVAPEQSEKHDKHN